MSATAASPSDDAGLVRAALVSAAAAGALLTAGGAALGGWRTLIGVALGAAAAVANLWVLARMVRAFVADDGRQRSWTLVALVKLLLLLAGMWLLVRAGVAQPIALGVGFAALPLGIVAAQLRAPREREPRRAGAGDQP